MMFIDAIPFNAIIGRYEGIYVALSFVIAVMASYVALDFALQLRREESPVLKRYWHIGGAFLIGAGVWCMHFTGMLAYNMGMEHKYEVGKTLLSLLLPILFAYAIFQIIKRPQLKLSTLLLASPILALSILSMHYTGMHAMEMPIKLYYLSGWFTVSVLIAVIASAGALWAMYIYAYRQTTTRLPIHFLSALILGTAICGMHYAGMAAAVFVPEPDCIINANFPDRPVILAIAIGVITFLIFTIAIGALRINEVMARHLKEQVKIRTEELEVANHDLLLAKETAETASIAKSEFLANMSHEIRTPMNAIVGIAHILRNDLVSPDKRTEFLDTLESSSASLMGLLNEILDISKIEANKIQLEIIEFNLRELIEEIIALISIRANEKGLAISLAYDPSIGSLFIGDPLRIRQVLVNLLSNAVKFTHQGQVEMTVQYSMLPFEGDAQPIEITVQDSGVGISDKKISTIFEKFTQEDASTTRKFGGTGLGLSICKALTEKMGGMISVSSVAGRGSLFVVTLPLVSKLGVQPEGHAKQKQDTDHQQHTDQSNNKFCILLVEDSAANILVASSYLKNLGYDYEVARNGREALAAYRRRNYDAILMDIHMPELDGFDVARAIRESEQKSDAIMQTPIIALTAFATEHDREKCLRHGMDDYLAKPFRIEDLQSKLEHYLFQKDYVVLPDRMV